MDCNLDFLKKESVMNLCVIRDFEPWCSPVYYVFDKSFYFFSSPDSIHILYGINNKVSCSVFSNGNEIKDIKGLQMKGCIYRPGKIESLNGFAKYMKKFSYLFSYKSLNLDFFESEFKSKLFGFRPEYIVYTDNSTGFGTKTIIEPENL